MNYQKFLSYLGTSHTKIKMTGNYVEGVWKGLEVQYLILEIDEDGAFYLLAFDKQINRYEGTYVAVYDGINYNIFKTSELDFRICVEQRFEAIIKDKKQYEKLYLFEVKDLIRRIV